ncbi:SHOCT domain-containing protein [Actinotalea sp. AC32]|nr:SHOCT domain-containing protein [Actinotalea sp. AC32]
MSWGYGMGAGMWGSGIILTLVMVLVVLLVLRASEPRTPPGRSARPRTALGILAERYARGEITTDEYEKRLSHLSS